MWARRVIPGITRTVTASRTIPAMRMAAVPVRTFAAEHYDKIIDPSDRKIARGAEEFGETKMGRGADNPTLEFMYRNLFANRPAYFFLILVAGVVGTELFLAETDAIWNNINKKDLFENVIPTQFPNLPPGTGEEEEDEDDDDDDDE